MCLVDRFSVLRFFVLLFFVFSGLGEVKGQNVINIYYPDEYLNESSEKLLDKPGAYSGEYQVFADLLSEHWGPILNGANGGNYRMLHTIEMVSYPFFPVTDGTNNRKLTTIPDEFYITSENNANIDDYSRWENTNWLSDYNVDFVWNRTRTGVNEIKKTIASIFFNGGQVSTNGVNDGRTILPHSAFKHTFHLLYCGTSNLETPIDSYSFIIDLTRGKMTEYPFSEQNYVQTNEGQHDVFIYPFIELSNSFEATDNPPFHTIDYFPVTDVVPYPIEGFDDCDEYVSFKFYPEIGEAINNPSTNPVDYLHPSPFSLIGFHIQGSAGAYPIGLKSTGFPSTYEEQHGIEHEYEINENLDLTLINPEEKIIYNPSMVRITATDLVFPSNYKFMTVRQNYATRTQTEAEASESTLCDMLNLEHLDLRDVPVPTDLQDYVSYEWTTGGTTTTIDAPSFYILEDNSKLTIESCVQIFDAVFIVKYGGELHYDATQTYGNFQIMAENGGTIFNELITGNKSCHDCRCMNEFNHDNGLEIGNGKIVDWTSGMHIQGQIVVRNGGKLTINDAHIEFADTDIVGTPTGITVEAGGTLEIYNSRLTSLLGRYCGNGTQMWDGIRLVGTGDGAKDFDATLIVENSYIENARTAIETQGYKYSNINGQIWESGGEVIATNVKFLNNHISFYGSSFNPNFEFVSCIFDQTVPTTNLFAHAVFFGISKGTFKSCRFANQISNQFDIEDRGIGIFAVHTQVEVSELNDGELPNAINQNSIFENLYKGIDHYGFLTTTYLDVSNTDFSNVLRGITMNSSQNDKIINNRFDMGTNILEQLPRDGSGEITPPILTYGVYAFDAQSYEIEKNSFDLKVLNDGTLFPSEITDYKNSFSAYGIIGRNSTIQGGFIYDNNFEELDYGIQTEEDNQSIEITCNEHSNLNKQAWYINPTGGNPQINDLFADQGSGCAGDFAVNPAGNIFYSNCPSTSNSSKDIKVGVIELSELQLMNGGFTYWPNGGPNTIEYPDCYSGAIKVEGQCDPGNRNIFCPEADLTLKVNAWMSSYTPIEIANLIETGNYSSVEQTQLTFSTISLYQKANQTQKITNFVDALSSDQALDFAMKHYLSIGNGIIAQNKLNEMDIRSLYDSDYIDFYQLLIDLKGNNRYYNELTPTEQQLVESIANSNSYASVRAQSLLTILNLTPYERTPLVAVNHSEKKANSGYSELQVYPNPSQNQFAIDVREDNAYLSVYKMNGIIVTSMVLNKGKHNIALDLPMGTYIVSVKTDRILKSSKIIVAH